MKRRHFSLFFSLILLCLARGVGAEPIPGTYDSFDEAYHARIARNPVVSVMHLEARTEPVLPNCSDDYQTLPSPDLLWDAFLKPLHCNPDDSEDLYETEDIEHNDSYYFSTGMYPVPERDIDQTFIMEFLKTAKRPSFGIFVQRLSFGKTEGGRAGPYETVVENERKNPEEKEGVAGDEPLYDVPVEINKRVERFIRYYQTKGRRFFGRWLERSSKYLPMIKRIFREEGLPEDLAYLALIESGFNPRARSRAHAVGLWQFMRGTAGKYGLRTDWWMDERRDPEKSTRAAARYLKDLYEMFGSWYLAVAGYNAGEGRIKRAVRRHRSIDFWVIAKSGRSLKKETRNYVPKYVAALLIAKEPGRYGFNNLDYEAPLEYDKVRIQQAMDIKIIARAAGTTVKEIRRLNPELLRWFTPPNYPNYEIKIPMGRKEVFAENMKRIPPPERLRFHRHRVKRGETLWSIARKYGTGIRPIKYLNNLKSARLIREGSILVVPVRARNAVHVKKTRYTYADMPVSGTYTVKKGDTLWDISTRFKISLKLLMKWNGLDYNDILMPGQKLLLREAAL